jgi:tRNA (adenine57-N1/adenine58-N1)-methyltransferase
VHLKASALPRRFPGHAAHDPVDGDIVLLRDKKNTYHEGTLVKLESSKKIQTHRGTILHSDVIGKEPRQLVQSSKGASYRIHEPTLAEYVRLTPRLVTPVRLLRLKMLEFG